MLLEQDDFEKKEFTFLIKPNRSTTVKGMIIFVLLVGLAIFLVAMRFVLLGAWVVLPFAVLEVILLAAGFWLYERSTRYREIITITKEKFSVLKTDRLGEVDWSFNPNWVTVKVYKDAKDWYPSRLFVSAHGERVEIGSCLINQERDELSLAIRQAIPAVLSQ